jgi:hypothetical protein
MQTELTLKSNKSVHKPQIVFACCFLKGLSSDFIKFFFSTSLINLAQSLILKNRLRASLNPDLAL